MAEEIYAQVADSIEEIEAEMRSIGYWSSEPPSWSARGNPGVRRRRRSIAAC